MSAARIVLDSNLLLLLVVGLAGEGYIAKHRRLRAYTVEDFKLLIKVISGVDYVVVSPNTLTETSNLLAYISEPDRTFLFKVFDGFIQKVTEKYFESRQSSKLPDFSKLGLADTVLLELASTTDSLLTADLELYLAASKKGRNVLNFNHLRQGL